MDFLSGVGAGAMRTRLESPRVCYATPGLPIGPTRASRRRQLPTNQCHAALPSPVIRAYQPDSSSQPSHRHPRADALGKPSASSRDFRGCQCRSRDRPRPNNRLTAGPSISADLNYGRCARWCLPRRPQRRVLQGPFGGQTPRGSGSSGPVRLAAARHCKTSWLLPLESQNVILPSRSTRSSTTGNDELHFAHRA